MMCRYDIHKNNFCYMVFIPHGKRVELFSFTIPWVYCCLHVCVLCNLMSVRVLHKQLNEIYQSKMDLLDVLLQLLQRNEDFHSTRANQTTVLSSQTGLVFYQSKWDYCSVTVKGIMVLQSKWLFCQGKYSGLLLCQGNMAYCSVRANTMDYYSVSAKQT